jgi:Raf kinase inhibitor-like YbhB/YbcL family protein
MLGKNSFGNMHYNGPCPPKGSLHHYTFTVYALDKMLDTSILDAPMLLKTMEDHIIGQASTSTSYARWPT